MNLIVLGGSCLIYHDPTKFVLILALESLDNLLGFVWLEIHFQIIDDVSIRCRRETEVDLGVRIV